MASHLYHFLTRWRLEATAEEAFDLLIPSPIMFAGGPPFGFGSRCLSQAMPMESAAVLG